MKREWTIAALLLLLFGIGSVSWQSQAQEPEPVGSHAEAPAPGQPTLAVPASIRTEHQHLHHQLEAAIAAGGKTGAAAKAVADVLAPHFEDEEAYAMPPLGLLGALARGEPIRDEQVRQAIAMAERLRSNYDQMLAEHVQIHAALKALAAAAREEHKPGPAAFAEALMQHAGSEEELLYPTTLLIGKYLELQQRSGK
jgi:hypothetical protein